MGDETIALNRRARHEFTIEDTFEAGIVLTGTEIKWIRARKVNLADAFARIERDEAWLIGPISRRWSRATGTTTSRSGRASCCCIAREIDELLG